MKTTEFEKQLKHSLHQKQSDINPVHMEQVKMEVRKEIVIFQKRKHCSFVWFLGKQIKYIGWKLWGMQGLLLLMLNRAITNLSGQEFWESPRALAKLLSCLSVLIVMSSLPMIYRVVRYKMHEIEAATYFSSVKLLLAKLVVIGIGDVLLLSGMFVIAITKTTLYAGNATIYLCLPFLLAGSGCLYMLGHFSTKNFAIGSCILCTIVLMLCAFTPEQMNILLHQSMSVGWLAVFAVLIVFCIQQFEYLLKYSNYAELQIGS